MPKTIINVPADIVANIPQTSSSDDPAQQTTTDPGKTDKTETKDTSSAKTSNTGFLTKDVSSSSLSSQDIAPIAFGSIFFIGIIILCATIVKLRLRRISSNYSLKKRQTSRILGVFSGLMMLAGLGGLAGGIFSSSAINMPVEDITTSSTVTAKLVDYSDTYKLYCGVDTITFNKATRNGWILRAYGENDATLASKDSKNANIASIDDWKELPVGSWGFKTDRELYEELTEQNQYKPINLGSGVIAQSIFASEAGDTIDVTYCAKVDAKTVGDFSATVNYEAKLIGTNSSMSSTHFLGGLMNYADYDLDEDEDGDEMTNREENRYGLNPRAIDTDNDGLFDNEELFVYGTDPLNDDTDGDDLIDYSEVALDLDPLNSKTDGVTNDFERETIYTYEDEDMGIKVEIAGTGNTPIFTFDAYDEDAEAANEVAIAAAEEADEKFEPVSTNIFASELDFYTEGNMTSATITLEYDDPQQLIDAGLTEDNIAIYYVDEDNSVENRIETTHDENAKTISATVDHFSKYRVRNAGEEEYLIPGVIDQPNDVNASAPGGVSGPTTVKSTKGDKLKYDNDNKKDKIIADSTFRSDIHGLRFQNYASNISEGGNCLGMSRFNELRFMKNLPTKNVAAVSNLIDFYHGSLAKYIMSMLTETMKEKGTAIDIEAVHSYAFNFSNTDYIDDQKDLVRIPLKTDVLKYTEFFKWDDLDQTNSRSFTEDEARVPQKNALMYDFEGGKTVFTTNEYANGESPLLYTNEFDTGKMSYYFNLDGMNGEGASVDNNDKQLFNAINYYQWKQYSDKKYISSSIVKNLKDNISLSSKQQFKESVLTYLLLRITRNVHTTGGKMFINTLSKYINQKDPVNLGLDIVNNKTGEEIGGHAVNALRVIQSGANSNRYYVEVLDSNYPKETMVITMDCNLSMCKEIDYRNANSNRVAPGYKVKNVEMHFDENRTIIPTAI